MTIAEASRLTYNVLITGGTGGIGQAIAHRFASHPLHRFNIVVISRDVDRARKAVLNLPRRDDLQKHSYIVGDVANLSFWERVAEALPPRHGKASSIVTAERITIKTPVSAKDEAAQDLAEENVLAPRILINAAGFAKSKAFLRTTDDTTTSMLNVNLLATMRACRHMGKSLRSSVSKDDPRIVTPNIINISSVLANIGGDGVAAYATAKAGILGTSHFTPKRKSINSDRIQQSTGH
jgi:NAD(P)-dependent dehydrogenase (short-subunit alcohol dehydrogenase family)